MGFIIEKSGNHYILNVQGSRLWFMPAGANIWRCKSAGEFVLKRVGQLMELRTAESRLWGYPTNTGDFICEGNFDPGPDPDPGPGTGTFSWPYEPTAGHWVSSEYGPRSGRFHEGIDFSGGPASMGEPIPCIADGTVYRVRDLGGSSWGRYTIIFHGAHEGVDIYSLYGHMSAMPLNAEGATVTKGQNLGPIGNSGASFGAHLHLETHVTSVGGSLRWDNNNPSYSSPRTAMSPRSFFNTYGDNAWIIS